MLTDPNPFRGCSGPNSLRIVEAELALRAELEALVPVRQLKARPPYLGPVDEIYTIRGPSVGLPRELFDLPTFSCLGSFLAGATKRKYESGRCACAAPKLAMQARPHPCRSINRAPSARSSMT